MVQALMYCDKSARIMLEAGVVTVTCTLEPHDGPAHYDEAFSEAWTEYVEQAD